MLAAAKARPIRLSFRPRTPRKVISEVIGKYGRYLYLLPPQSKGDVENWFETDLARETGKRLTPGKTLRHLREMTGLTLDEVGKKVGVSPQRVADWEADRRGISKDKARKLGEIFDYPAGDFI